MRQAASFHLFFEIKMQLHHFPLPFPPSNVSYVYVGMSVCVCVCIYVLMNIYSQLYKYNLLSSFNVNCII